MNETLSEIGHYKFYQFEPSHKLTSVTVLLCDFLGKVPQGSKVVDLGTGSGPIPLLLTLKSDARDITGVEISSNLIEIAEKNINENSLEKKIKLVNSDWRNLYDTFSFGSFDYVVSNPPYMKLGSGRISDDKDRAGARAEIYGDMSDIIKVSKHLAGDSGRIYFVYPIGRLEQLEELIGKEGLSVGRFKYIYTKEDSFKNDSPKFFLIEFGVDCEFEKEEGVLLDGSRIY